jgi:ABC-2 type transport system ATP-binding protein
METKNICKSYGSIDALRDINLRFMDKKIYGLFGRNGAGKTTLLNTISSRIFADHGNVTYLGEDILENPKSMAENCCYMPEKHYFPDRFKVKTLLSHANMFFPNYSEQTAERLCRYFHLNTEQKYGQLSRGFQSIFRIVLGLAANAAITIFDEPVLGLDAVARDQFYSELIEEFSEAIIIKDGEVIRQASVEDLLSNVFYVSGKSTRVDEFVKNRTVIGYKTVDDLKTAVVDGDLSKEKRSPGLNYSSLTIQKLFIHLTNDKNEQEQWR